MDGGVAGVADYEGFAPAFCHVLCPRWLWLPGPGEVGELADLVNFGAAGVPADLAPSGEEPGDQFLAADDLGWLAVGDDRCFLPGEGYASELGCPAFSGQVICG